MKTIFTIITSTILLVPIQFSSGVAAEEKLKIEKEQVGRFALHIVNKGEQHILYRIDTVTGAVSIFDPNEKAAMSPEDWKKLGPQWQSAKEKIEKLGLFPYQLPFWNSLPEKLSGIRTDGK